MIRCRQPSLAHARPLQKVYSSLFTLSAVCLFLIANSDAMAVTVNTQANALANATQSVAKPNRVAAKAPQSTAIGRLFFSPEERTALEQPARAQPTRVNAAITVPKPKARPTPLITGFVRRSDGVDTLFLDNAPNTALPKQQPELLVPSNVGRPLKRTAN